jgi:hypothetical protein
MVAKWKKVAAGAPVALLAIYTAFEVLEGLQEQGELRPLVLERTNAALQMTAGPMSRKLGFLLALKYYEQQTQATKNFLQLQCLASNYSMQVVEPFVTKSMFSFPVSLPPPDQTLKFGDLIDMELWNQNTVTRYGYPPVASWENFLNNAPRDVALVCVKCRDPPAVKIPIPGANFRHGCVKGCFDKFDSILDFISIYGFRVVRKACANFEAYAGTIGSHDFLDNILSPKYHQDNITVILSEFRGFFGLYRMQILSPCGLITHADMKHNMVMPSKKLVQEAKVYSKMNFNEQPYISILVRVEKIVLHSMLNITKCANEVVLVLEGLKKKFSLKEYFLAMDVGKYGSIGAILHHLQPQGKILFKRVYGERWTFHQWEKSFSQASSNDNPAYVANLQRTLAAMGRCLLMVGSGGFQAQAKSLYDKYHPDVSSRCVHTVCVAK